MANIHRLGFTELSPRETLGQDPFQFNIIFVHGLGGHPQKTWEGERRTPSDSSAAGATRTTRLKGLKAIFQRHRHDPDPASATGGSEQRRTSDKVFWPQDYLAEDMSTARVWTYGYNADVIEGLFQANNKNSVSTHGRDLAAKLELHINNEDPIVFIAHSLGGIIVKDAIRRSPVFRARTRLVIFLGTPHRGSTMTGWGEIASNLVSLALQDSNKNLVQTLEVNSEVLDNIQEEFQEIVHDGSIRVYSFQEAKGISGIKGLHGKVVENFSSMLGVSRHIETVQSIDADHRQMARCRDRTDPQYRDILGVFKKLTREGLFDRDHTMNLGLASSTGGAETESHSTPDGTRIASREKVLHYVPFEENESFTGREGTVDRLKEMFFGEGRRKIALVGLGGIGKTQVALHFANWVKRDKPDHSTLWIPAVNNASIEQAYTELATQLAIRKATEDENVKESVRRHLNSEAAGKWLLIVDNLDDSDQLNSIREYIPTSKDGMVLFTTRSRKVAVSAARSNLIDLPQMQPTEAKSLLHKSVSCKERLENEASSEALLKELAYLPLAITQAAAYLESNLISTSEYLRLMQTTEENMAGLLSREFDDETRYKGSQHAVATTWLVSFKKIRESEPAAADLLTFISCIEAEAIPQRMLPAQNTDEQLVHAVGTLCAYSFLVRRGQTTTYDMHSLVHLAARTWIRQNGDLAEATTQAVSHLKSIFPSDDYENQEWWRMCMPHAFAALEREVKIETPQKYHLCYWLGRCLKADGRIREAVKFLQKSYDWRKQQYPEPHPSRLASQHALAGAYRANGQVKEAVELLEHVVAVRSKTLTESHPSRLASQHELAGAYGANGQVKEAVELLEHVVAVESETLTESHPSRLASQHALAGAYGANGQVKEAVELLEHVVAVKSKTLTESHPDLTTS